MRIASHRACRLLAPVLIFLVQPLFAGPPSDTLLPGTTKGYVSVARPGEFKERWLKTQIGQMLNDELMQPFVEDLRTQIQEEYSVVEDKLGIAFDDLEGVAAGELSLAVIERKEKDAALAITIDVTGHEQQADRLLAAIEKRFAARGGRHQMVSTTGPRLHYFTVPAGAGEPPQVTVYFIKENVLCGVDDRDLAAAMLQRFEGGAEDNLSAVAAYQAVMDRCRQEAKGLEPEARWFVEPFGFIFAARTLQKSHTRSTEQDFVQMFYETGFNAVQGAGGYVNQLVEGDIELMHRSYVYAPPVNANDPLRWTESMRMLQLPNADGFEPQSFVPRMTASYSTFLMRISDAFDNVGPLFDAIQAHENAWNNTLEGWKNDPYGPKVDVRKEIVAHLGERISLVTGYQMPISTESEQSLFVVEATNEKALSEAIAKWMSREPDVERRQIGPYIVWERVARNHAVEELDVQVPGFDLIESDDEEAAEDEEDRERVLPNSVVTVALGHLMMASDIEFLGEILEGFGQRDRLASSSDYDQVVKVLNGLAPGQRSGLSFGRSDEEFRPTFELVRQGKMPESKTMVGKLLNKLLRTEQEREEGVLRQQQIDGSTLPSFEAVRRYFGPHGRVVRSDKDGWLITGAVLNKEAP